MSLEQIIAANTEAVAAQTSAINTLIGLLQNSANTVQSVKSAEGTTSSETLANDKADAESAKKAKAAEAKAEKAKANAEAVAAAEAKAAAEAAKTKTVVVTEDGVLTLAEVSPIVVALAKKDRAAAVSLLGEYGAKKATELKPEDYAEFVAKANAIINGESEDDLV